MGSLGGVFLWVLEMFGFEGDRLRRSHGCRQTVSKICYQTVMLEQEDKGYTSTSNSNQSLQQRKSLRQ